MADVLLFKQRIGFYVQVILPDNCYVKIENGNQLCVYQAVVEPWLGDGLPPVNTVCECHLPGELTNNYSWVEAKVIWHNGPTECAVIHNSRLKWCDEFRPVKTPELSAAHARTKACDAMYGIMTSPPARDGNRSDMAEALYDAGYRKFEITDDSDPA